MSVAIPVLLYHSVTLESSPDESWGAVSGSEFAAQVDAILESGREPITVTTLAEGLRGERPLPTRPVAVTFDDGYANTLAAAQLLSATDLPCTAYVTTDEIGAPDRLAAGEVAHLASVPGVELGAHAVNHRRLDELSDTELDYELRASRAYLEQLIGKRVDSFAYPHGAYDRRVREAVIGVGYRSAAAVKNALSHPGDDPFAIARWTVTPASSPQRIAEVLDGIGVPFAWDRERLRTSAYRTVRRARRRLFGARTATC